jgi:hypothetical protein
VYYVPETFRLIHAPVSWGPGERSNTVTETSGRRDKAMAAVAPTMPAPTILSDHRVSGYILPNLANLTSHTPYSQCSVLFIVVVYSILRSHCSFERYSQSLLVLDAKVLYEESVEESSMNMTDTYDSDSAGFDKHLAVEFWVETRLTVTPSGPPWTATHARAELVNFLQTGRRALVHY